MYANILVPIDISYNTQVWQRPALTNAWRMAQMAGGRIHVITVVPNNLLKGYYPDLAIVDKTEDKKKKLEAILRDIVPKETSITFGVEFGGVCSEILRVARELPADVIVMASHGPMTKDYLLGSNAAHIALHAPCSVFVVRELRNTNRSKAFMEEALGA